MNHRGTENTEKTEERGETRESKKEGSGRASRCPTFSLLFSLFALLSSLCSLCLCGSNPPKKLDPTEWGGDHVGKSVPEYLTGDECLFCHRQDVGPTWRSNRHHLTIRPAEGELPSLAALKRSPAKEQAAEVKLVLGSANRQRFLKPSSAYGMLELLSTEWVPPRGKKEAALLHAEKPHWDAKTFGDGCAGCHATGVNGKTRAFSAVSLDCYVCHGEVDPKHSKNATLVHLAKKRNDPPRVVTSICAQCHIRSGKSRSTGLPYPNTFVAGDNLFRDFQVDLSDDTLRALNPADRHILANVRDVVVLGKEDVTCLSCHDVHVQSSKKHHLVANSNHCTICHNETGPKKVRPPYEVHSKTCGY